MERQEAISAISPLLRSRWLRLLLIGAPAIMASVAVLTAGAGAAVGVAILANGVAAVIISTVLFYTVSLEAHRVAQDRVSLAKAAEEGQWRARTRLVSIRHEDDGLYTDWYFRLRLQEEIDRSARYNLHFAIVLGKPTFIHNELDARATSGLFYDRLRHTLRRSDLPAILQDGTLAVLLPHTMQGAPVEQRIAKSLFVANVEVGSCCYPEDGEDIDTLLRAAAANTRVWQRSATPRAAAGA
jgi:hypothetical protein